MCLCPPPLTSRAQFESRDTCLLWVPLLLASLRTFQIRHPPKLEGGNKTQIKFTNEIILLSSKSAKVKISRTKENTNKSLRAENGVDSNTWILMYSNNFGFFLNRGLIYHKRNIFKTFFKPSEHALGF